MAKGGPYCKENMMKQSLYFDESELEILNKNKNEEQQTMPTETEKIIFIKKKSRIPYKCDSCPIKSPIVYFLVVGDTELIKVCPYCRIRLKKSINHNH
jgi:hypothetical protein